MKRTLLRLLTLFVLFALSLSATSLAEIVADDYIEPPVQEIESDLYAVPTEEAAVDAPAEIVESDVPAEEIAADTSLEAPTTDEAVEEAASEDAQDAVVVTKPRRVVITYGRSALMQVNDAMQLEAEVAPDTATTTYKWKTSDKSVVSVTKNGFITAKKKGSAKITVTTANGKKATLAVKVVDRMKPTKIKFSKNSVTVYVNGEGLDLRAGNLVKVYYKAQASDPQSIPLKWKSSNKSIAKVSADGVLTGVKVGTTKVTVTTENYKKATITVKVRKYVNPVKMKFSKKTQIMNLGDDPVDVSKLLKITYDKKSKLEKPAHVTWKSSKESVATVDDDGVVTALKKGSATITATARNGQSAKIAVKVNDFINPSTLSFTVNSVTLYLGKGMIDLNELLVTLYPARKPDNATPLSWESSDTDVAEVSDGFVSGIEEGTAKITVSAQNGESATINVKVVDPNVPTKLGFTEESTTAYIGTPFDLKSLLKATYPDGTPDKPTADTWTISDSTLATVDNGVVSGLAEGTATVTVTGANGKAEAAISVTIVDPNVPTKLSFTEESTTAYIGTPFDLKSLLKATYPVGTPDKPTADTWTISDSTLATVDNGVVSGLAEGTATVTVTGANGKAEAAISVTVVDPAIASKLTFNKELVYVSYKGSLDLKKEHLTITYPEGKTPTRPAALTWESDNSAVTVENGVLTGVQKGSATITVTSANGKASASITAEVVDFSEPVKLSFSDESVTIELNADPKDAKVDLYKLLQIEYPAEKPKNLGDKGPILNWSIDNSTIATIDELGVVQAKREGTANVTVATVDDVTASIPVNVVYTFDHLSIIGGDIRISTGLKWPLEVKIDTKKENAPDPTLTWKSSNPKIATVDETGVITASSNKGRTKITVAHADDQKAEIEVTVSDPSVLTIRDEYGNAGESYITVDKDKNVTFTYQLEPNDVSALKEIEWSIQPSGVVTHVSGSTFTVDAEGTATITARLDKYGIEGTFIVKAKSKLIDVTETRIQMKVNETYKLPVTYYHGNSTADIRTVNSNEAVVKGVLSRLENKDDYRQGTLTITANKAGEGKITLSDGSEETDIYIVVK